ncbi:MAG: hypothetical protein OHK0047_23770 [Leptolyngbyaceae cyanobacterium]
MASDWTVAACKGAAIAVINARLVTAKVLLLNMEKTDELRTKVCLLEVFAKESKVAPNLNKRSLICFLEFP